MRRRTGFLVGILFQLLAIFGLFVPYVLLVSSGTEITLRTLPIDPRSVFRGDYVVLGYEAGAEIPFAQIANEKNELPASAFVVLEKKGDTYERVSVSRTQPVLKEGQVCLRGVNPWTMYDVPQPVNLIFPDISQYFVEEGLGREFESARNAHRLLVKVSVSPSCMAVVKGVVLGPEVPQSEFPTVPDVETKPEPITPAV